MKFAITLLLASNASALQLEKTYPGVRFVQSGTSTKFWGQWGPNEKWDKIEETARFAKDQSTFNKEMSQGAWIPAHNSKDVEPTSHPAGIYNIQFD